jgi:predicted nuclease of predicted toxin-antitoxin system
LKGEERIRIYADENVNVAIVDGLKRRGVEAWSAIDKGNLGLSDEEQLRYAQDEKATIFTHDDDFLSMAVESGIEHFGIIYVHQQHLSVGECIRG